MQELKEFVEQMRATSSSLDKVKILKQQSDFIKKVLEYTYNPYKQYYVTSKTCKKNFNIRNMFPDEDLFDLLDDLTNRKITGHDAIAAVNGFVTANPASNSSLVAFIASIFFCSALPNKTVLAIGT